MGLKTWQIMALLPVLAALLLVFVDIPFKRSASECSLYPHAHFWIASKRIVTPNGVISGAVEIRGEKIASLVEGDHWQSIVKSQQVIDYGDAVIMPGLIDVHAHLDDPGREDWEGFPSGTRAAAAGGITTLIDMPLNSFPSTVSAETLALKLQAAAGRIYVDVGFWGGLVPENAMNTSTLDDLLKAGVLGLKSFMCPSGINDFPMTNISHIKEGLITLGKYRRPLLVHAEIPQDQEDNSEHEDGSRDPRSYAVYLKSRPASWEEAAIRDLLTVSSDTRIGGAAEGAHLHIVHLSDARSSLELIKEAKKRGDSVTVETCPHYLAFAAEEIPDGDTRFKCAPPIRDAANREKLWGALMEGDIDFLSSDHSPSVPELKLFNEGDFLRAWGGISSLQFVLPVSWSFGKRYGISLAQLASWWSERPAKFSGLTTKGEIVVGYQSDFVVWEPETEVNLDDNHPVFHKHRNISAYMGSGLSGKILATFVKGNLVFKEGKHALACGSTILAKEVLRCVDCQTGLTTTLLYHLLQYTCISREPVEGTHDIKVWRGRHSGQKKFGKQYSSSQNSIHTNSNSSMNLHHHHHHHSLITLHKPPPYLTFFSRRKTIRRHLVCFSSDSTHKLKLAQSLQSETLQILEWPAVCAQLSAFTSTSMGLAAAQSARIPLGRSPEESKTLLAQTTAALGIPQRLDFSGIKDVSPILESAVAGNLLTVQELCLLKLTLRSARHLVEQLEGSSTDEHLSARCSPLLEILQGCNFLNQLEEKIEFCVDCKFSQVLDRASKELAFIRSERKKNMESLDTMLKQTSNRIFQAGGIDKPLVTERRSRLCVAVRASHRSLIPDGVVLDVSSSGATYFMEPREAINLNNEEVRLSDNEKMEERVILSLLTSEIAEFKSEIKHLLSRVLDLDLAFARAAHAKWMEGACPIFSSESSEGSASSSFLVNIEGIQHPLLLESSLQKSPNLVKSVSKKSKEQSLNNDSKTLVKSPVPVDIKIVDNVKVVVISGPNTGGKTASMKTLGLASIMFKAGMYLPAQNNPQLPWFDFILADIGDQQSLEQSLSTFSGHISRLRKILEATSEKSLILIDEIGSGTDPSEGVALSASMLQYVVDRVKLAVVTTHYADLTRLKEKDNRFENAAMEFSLETLQPTYRMLWRSTGESNAISIAKSIGFNGKLIQRAQEWLGKLTPEKMQMQKGLLYQSLAEEKNILEMQATKAASLHSDVMSIYSEYLVQKDDLDGRVAALKAKERQRMLNELKAAKTQIANIVRDFENQLSSADANEYNVLLKKAESAINSIVEAQRPSNDPSIGDTASQFYEPKPGEKVLVKELGNKLATVIETPGEDDMVLVQYGKVKVRVNKRTIRALENADVSGGMASVSSSKRQQGLVVKNLKDLRDFSETINNEEVSYGPAVQTSKNTIDLRGMRGEEATRELEMAINSRGPGSVIFIIHGMGTGVVKERALQLLKSHPRVAKFEQESPMNYGCTVAYMK
ncbi:OLC1v1021552C1 [Oldenlandia corymbosa var. corymbosa]|uniref:allantoinase n=1 Tax=Oldenlandia corymbosa var. corymbosa TaxID=529605 RepID=A0AAV1BY70_OLDCO|nr:OLC1v1021552C1 [Oldenlandia corymbosa var. corymbosa]